MKIKDIRKYLEGIAPLSLQESYDNSGLLVGNDETECTGIITSLDVTEAVIKEAVAKNCNLIVAHHPVIFRGIKRLNGSNYVERTIIAAIKNDIAIYAIHTNLDNVLEGVNKKIAEKYCISISTIRTHICNIYSKLHVHSKSAAVAKILGRTDRKSVV